MGRVRRHHMREHRPQDDPVDHCAWDREAHGLRRGRPVRVMQRLVDVKVHETEVAVFRCNVLGAPVNRLLDYIDADTGTGRRQKFAERYCITADPTSYLKNVVVRLNAGVAAKAAHVGVGHNRERIPSAACQKRKFLRDPVFAEFECVRQIDHVVSSLGRAGRISYAPRERASPRQARWLATSGRQTGRPPAAAGPPGRPPAPRDRSRPGAQLLHGHSRSQAH